MSQTDLKKQHSCGMIKNNVAGHRQGQGLPGVSVGKNTSRRFLDPPPCDFLLGKVLETP